MTLHRDFLFQDRWMGMQHFNTAMQVYLTIYTVGQKGTSILLPITLTDIDGFSKFLTVEFTKKFATKWLLHCQPHLKRVAALPCEMTVVKNRHFHIKTIRSTSVVTNKCHFMMKFKCKLQRLFKMSPFCMDTGTKSWKPLVDRVVDNVLLQAVSCVNQMLLQIVNVSHLRPINVVLHRTPHLVVNRVEAGAAGSNESRNLLLQ